MSVEILNGLIGGVLGPMFGKILGRFKLWKVFAVCLILIYLAIFLIGAFYVGPRQSFFELWQFVQPRALLVFVGISGGATLVAFLIRSTQTTLKVVDVNSAETERECKHNLEDKPGSSKST